MKKAVKIILIVFILLAVVAGALAVWQWKNIEGIYIGVTQTSEDIIKKRESNQKDLVNELDSYMDSSLRELTDEEKAQLESGDVLISDVYSKIFEEKQDEIKKSEEKKVKKPTKDEIISKYMVQLYKLQSEFTAKAESTISQGRAYYENLRKTQDWATARANTITHFTPIVRGVESECDARVNSLIEKLTAELKEIGENTDIVGTIKSTYANEKQLKLAYYSNKYLK